VDAVLLTNSCARGCATPDSCLDILVLAPENGTAADRAALTGAWRDHYASSAPVFDALRRAGRFSVVHLDVHDGAFAPGPREDDEDIGDFELQIGNYVAYAHPLWQRTDRFARLRAAWLPFYDDTLRRERLAAADAYCRDCLDHIAPYVARGLHFQAFDRLYNAFRAFLQCLFLARSVYPIAYNKWLRQQIVDLLHLPDLYPALPRLFEISRFESDEVIAKADDLRRLLDQYGQESTMATTENPKL
jgi:hypothetical protein